MPIVIHGALRTTRFASRISFASKDALRFHRQGENRHATLRSGSKLLFPFVNNDTPPGPGKQMNTTRRLSICYRRTEGEASN
eukprot:scaffold4250_cov247-Pinguiococcus_pyrenoidosus.AAC.4